MSKLIKYRIVEHFNGNGYTIYYPQWKLLFFWHYFTTPHPDNYCGEEVVGFYIKQEAEDFINKL